MARITLGEGCVRQVQILRLDDLRRDGGSLGTPADGRMPGAPRG